MFLVCEPIAWEMEHVTFNAAFLKVIRLAYPRENIYFYAEESHSLHVKKQVGDEVASTIQWKSITLPQRHSGFFSRMSSDFKLVRFLLDQLNGNNRNHVLVITGNPSLLWALKYNANSVKKDKRIQVVLHGDFSKLRYRASLKRHLNPFYHTGTLKTALKFACDQRIQYIVLEEAIRAAVLEKMPFLRNCFSVLEHPVPGDKMPVEASDFEAPVQIGFLGSASERKGFLKYLKVAEDIKKQYPGLVDFHFIGYILEHQKAYNFDCLSDKPSTQRLDRDEYVQRLNKLHFVCLFYEKEYEFTASGALLDCVEYGKPVIASELPLFKNIEKEMGDIGYLCKADEFRDIIATILRNMDPDRYKRQVQNMLKFKQSRSPEVLANNYRGLVDHCNA